MKDFFAERIWLTRTFTCSPNPVGMLGRDEASLFYWVARECFSGRGVVVDAGAFLGKSAVYLATGLRANPRFDPARHRVHCFDNFLVNESETIAFVRTALGKQLALGDSTRELFEAQVAPVRDELELHVGDFLAVPWQHRPIDLLMVDIAKSESLNRRVAEQFFPDLFPGSTIIQQDYHHPWLPHIHVTMEFLAPWCELVVPRCDDSAVFVVREAIPPVALQKLVRDGFPADEAQRLMDAAIERLPRGDRHYVELARIVLIGRLRGWRAARQAMAELASRIDASLADARFVQHVESVRDAIEEEQGWESKRAGDHADVIRCADALIGRGRSFGTALLLRGWAHREAGDLQASLADLRKGKRLPAASPWMSFELAMTLSALGDQAEARQELLAGLLDPVARRSLHLQPWLELLGLTWQRAFDLDVVRDQRALLQRVLADEPEAWAFDARVSVRLGDRTGAIAALRRARALGLGSDRLNATVSELGMSRAEWDVMFDEVP